MDVALEALSVRPGEATAVSVSRMEAKGVQRFALLVCSLVVLCACGTHVRNRAWQSMGNLWLDIAEKVRRLQVREPVSGEEVPRADRARIYNNIGLYLYNEARDLSILRNEITGVIASYESVKQSAGTAVQRQRLHGLELEIVRLYGDIETKRAALVAHVPAEFAEECRRRGMNTKDLQWDLFLPAALCLQRALFHYPTYHKAHLNLGLVEKLRAVGGAAGEVSRQEHLQRAIEYFRIASTIAPGYGLALRYLADVLLITGQAAEARRIAIRAVESHRASEGEAALFDAINQIIRASRMLGDYRTALDWVAVAEKLKPDMPEAYGVMRREIEAEQRRAGVVGHTPTDQGAR